MVKGAFGWGSVIDKNIAAKGGYIEKTSPLEDLGKHIILFPCRQDKEVKEKLDTMLSFLEYFYRIRAISK